MGLEHLSVTHKMVCQEAKIRWMKKLITRSEIIVRSTWIQNTIVICM